MAIVDHTRETSGVLTRARASIAEPSTAGEELLRVAQYLLTGIASGECSREDARNAICTWADGDAVLVERAARNAIAAGFPVEGRLLAESSAVQRVTNR